MKKLLWLSLTLVLINTVTVEARFADVDVTHPHFQAIEHLHRKDVVKGYESHGKKFFKGLQKVSRAEAVKMLMLASDHQVSGQAPSFSDIESSAWYSAYVGAAEERKIIKGFADGNFHPHAQVTRAEFLSMAYKAFRIPALEQLSTLQAGEKWFDPLLEFGIDFRILEDPTLPPHESISRGEVAEIIFRLQTLKDKDFSSPYVYSGSGSASYYNEGFAGKSTANGEVYDPYAMTAAHRTLPFGTKLRVWHQDKSIIVRINDRGPYHSSRILDLSEKAFSRLAPISRGVIEVKFEVYSGSDNEVAQVIPDPILEETSITPETPPIPEIIEAALGRTYNEVIKDSPVINTPSQRVFDDSVPHLPGDTFDGIDLRHPIPQTIVAGSIRHFSGRTTERSEKITLFLQPTGLVDPTKVPEQISFSAPVNDKNFVVPVYFLDPGTYQLGMVTNDNTRSKVIDITVKRPETVRNFSTTATQYPTEFSVNLIPEKQLTTISWPADSNQGRITKLEITGLTNNRNRVLYIEDGINRIELPYEFFDYFRPYGEEVGRLAIDLFAAESRDQTLNTQISNWQKLDYQNFVLLPGFEDSESSKIVVENFERFPGDVADIHIKGKITDKEVRLRSTLFVTEVGGRIRQAPLVIDNNRSFSSRVDFDDAGTYVIEIMSDQGEVLFNRAVYVYEDFVLPVLDWERVQPKSQNLVGVRYWINVFRRNQQLGDIHTDANLNDVAQQYADQMAEGQFIGHTSPTGVTFGDRLKQANLSGEYAENVSFGSDFQLALDAIQDSASHFRNVIDRKWTRVGIGVSEGKDGTYLVQIFGK